MYEDLSWFGFEWQEGPDVGGKHGPYLQSERRQTYMETFTSLRAGGFLYPCTCSRQDVLRSLQAPHAGEDEPIYPGTCRSKRLIQRGKEAAAEGGSFANSATTGSESATHTNTGMRINWRFAIPEGERVTFVDENYGPQEFVAGKDFGDFVVWRHDDIPSYQLAVVVDDVAMRITEVVRGEDLLRSTARQLLLYRALNCPPPRFYHCPLVLDETGQRMAKRHDALSLRALRTGGATPESLRCGW
jgi:glutamyl-tRNA synthetase